MSGPRFDDDLDYWVDNPDERPCEWAHRTMTPACPSCGGYLLPCTATATGVHPGLERPRR